MQAVYRLRKNKQFAFVYKKGASVASKNIVLVYARASGRTPKFGFSVSKKIGKSVQRNRAKRLMRENVRLLAPQIRRGCFLVFSARPGILDAGYTGIRRDILYLLKKAGLLSGGDASAAEKVNTENTAIKQQTSRGAKHTQAKPAGIAAEKVNTENTAIKPQTSRGAKHIQAKPAGIAAAEIRPEKQALT